MRDRDPVEVYDQGPGADGGRADRPRRAGVRYLFAAAEGADHLPDRPVYDQMSALICAQLLFLESENPSKDIAFYINSPGGVVSAGLAIYDTMQYIRSPVSTVCIGQAASMGSLLLCRRRQGQAFRAAERPHHGAPAVRRRPGPGRRHRNPGARNPDPAHRLNEIYGIPASRSRRSRPAGARQLYVGRGSARFGLVDEVVEVRPVPTDPTRRPERHGVAVPSARADPAGRCNRASHLHLKPPVGVTGGRFATVHCWGERRVYCYSVTPVPSVRDRRQYLAASCPRRRAGARLPGA